MKTMRIPSGHIQIWDVRLYREHKPQDDAMTIWIFIGPLPNLMNFREYLGIINF